MRMLSDCIACLALVRLKDVQKMFSSERDRLFAMQRVLSLIKDLAIDRGILSAPRIATAIFRWLKNTSGVHDPYRDEKKLADERALELYEMLKHDILSLSPRERVFRALSLSAAANALDLGVATYQPPKPSEVLKIAQNLPQGIEKAVDAILSAKRITVVMDNAGEAVLDRILADALVSLGKEVVAIVKSGAFQNDETIHDAKFSRLEESFHEVVSSGTDAASIFLDELSRKALSTIEECDLLVSKGMANYEYISDVENIIGKPTLYVLMAKCRPIALSLGVELKSLVTKVSVPTNYRVSDPTTAR